jgi:hypothetical protein
LHLAPPNHECPNSTHFDGASRAGGGAVHSIKSSLTQCSKLEEARAVGNSCSARGSEQQLGIYLSRGSLQLWD